MAEEGRSELSGRVPEFDIHSRMAASVVKMDLAQLREFTSRLNKFLREPSAAAIRICECCINVD